MLLAGVDLSPYWRVLPPSVRPEVGREFDGVPVLRIAAGAGFGDGSHPTTQLCLLALGALGRVGPRPRTAIDFGAGTGVLAIALARLGARVEAVEIDPASLVEAAANAAANGVSEQIELGSALRERSESVDLVVANILAGVLLDFAEPLAARLSRGGRMVLSGLLATDVPAILSRYRPLLAPMRHEVYERAVWRAVVFQG